MKVFVIYDVKSETYDRPIFFKTIAEAVRAFETALRDKESIFSKYKEDFEMVYVGDMDLEQGVLIPQPHQAVCAGLDYVETSQGIEDGKK